MKFHQLVLFFVVLALVLYGYGCASEGVSKPAAVQASGWAAFMTWLSGATGAASGGLTIVIGFLAGLVSLLFSRSTSTASPGGGSTPSGGIGLFGWLLIAVVAYIAWKERSIFLAILRQPLRAAKAIKRHVQKIGRAPTYKPARTGRTP